MSSKSFLWYQVSELRPLSKTYPQHGVIQNYEGGWLISLVVECWLSSMIIPVRRNLNISTQFFLLLFFPSFLLVIMAFVIKPVCNLDSTGLSGVVSNTRECFLWYLFNRRFFLLVVTSESFEMSSSLLCLSLNYVLSPFNSRLSKRTNLTLSHDKLLLFGFVDIFSNAKLGWKS